MPPTLFDALHRADVANLRASLAQFTGTEHWTRHWSRRLLYTDGVQFLAETAKAHWLIDAIASWQTHASVRCEPFQVWKLSRDGNGRTWWLRADDGNGHQVTAQRIPYSDFPLPEITLYVEDGGPGGERVLLLPSEH